MPPQMIAHVSTPLPLPPAPSRLPPAGRARGETQPAMLDEIEAFLIGTGMAATRFGRNAVRDPRIVLDMRNGRRPSARMCRRLRHYIATWSTAPRDGGAA